MYLFHEISRFSKNMYTLRNFAKSVFAAVRSLFSHKVDNFFDATTASRGVLHSICDSLHKYNLFRIFLLASGISRNFDSVFGVSVLHSAWI